MTAVDLCIVGIEREIDIKIGCFCLFLISYVIFSCVFFLLLIFVFHHSYVYIVELAKGRETGVLYRVRGPVFHNSNSSSLVTWGLLAGLRFILRLLLIDSHVLRVRKLLLFKHVGCCDY